MAAFPLVVNFVGDYGLKVLLVDAELTIAEVAAEAARQLAGVVVPPVAPGETLRVRVQGRGDTLPDDVKLTDAGLIEMETVEIHRERAS
ncbi:MAG: toluene-4-monooxygenase system B family protein [Thermodesulfobacteriota bacterium]